MGSGHQHGPPRDADRRGLTGALVLIAGFMGVEVVVGLLSGSLALLSDAAHMLTDAAALALALVALRIAARPASGRWTFGWKRVEVLSAQANGVTLLLLTVWFVVEAVGRLFDPPDVEGAAVLATAVLGLVVNLGATALMRRADRSSLNVEGAFQHVLQDLYASLAAATSGLLVLTTGATWTDPVAALVVACLMARAGWRLVRDSSRVFLETAPAGLDPDALGRQMVDDGDVVQVHDLHVWEITSGEPSLSAHVLARPGADCHAVRRRLEQVLADDHDLRHTTLQVDHAPPEVLAVTRRPDDRPPRHGAGGDDDHRC